MFLVSELFESHGMLKHMAAGGLRGGGGGGGGWQEEQTIRKHRKNQCLHLFSNGP